MMTTSTDSRYFVEVERSGGEGNAWTVRLYRKRFFGRKRISSDWFLDEIQAATFARQLEHDISETGMLNTIRARKPGWTLHRPSH